MNEFRLERLSRHRFEKSKFDKAILVTGATENHAYHLPTGTDTFAAYGIAEEVARKTPGTLLLPPLHFGVSDMLMPYPFTLTLTAETLAQVVFEVVESCIKQGITRFLIINGHGGNNSAIDIAMRKIHRNYPEAKVAASLTWWISGPRLLPEGTFRKDLGIGHAGEAETSTALYLVPDLVDMDVARGEWPQSPGELKLLTSIPETSVTGATGDPTGATPEKGQLIVQALSDYLARFLKEMDATGWDFSRKDWTFLTDTTAATT
ncbi:MAG TPA: creatininase family protein [Firmicutes bacterium]|nr:creatininase family protein [Candidatus Fermentithermobacillaceae bacterium]